MSVADVGATSYNARPSPDGSMIAFDSDRGGERAVYIANRDGTGVRRVSGDGAAAVPAWAPDGKSLAFLRAEPDRPHVWNLWTVNVQSNDAQRVTAFRGGETGAAAWFPDGRRLCYTHHDVVVVKDLSTGTEREYASPVRGRPARHPAVSPDGDYVVFQVAGSGGWLLDLSDGSMRRVLTDPTVEAFAWSADGQRVAFHSRRDDRWGIWVTGLPAER
jgi:Tol biopolymer transport system component